MVASEADTEGILRRLDKWHESFLDGTSQVSLEKFPFNETRPFLAEWLSKNIKWHCSCPPDDCQKTKSTISQNSLLWAQPRPRSSLVIAAKIKERGRKEISLIFRSMFWPRCQLTVIGFPENSRTLGRTGGNVMRGSKYILLLFHPRLLRNIFRIIIHWHLEAPGEHFKGRVEKCQITIYILHKIFVHSPDGIQWIFMIKKHRMNFTFGIQNKNIFFGFEFSLGWYL